jgi:uncharacterized protein (DUF302 family)
MIAKVELRALLSAYVKRFGADFPAATGHNPRANVVEQVGSNQKGGKMRHSRLIRSAVVLVLVGLCGLIAPLAGEAKDPSPRVVMDTDKPFKAFTEDLQAAIKKNKMGLVAKASAQAGAASIGATIPGNQVFMIYRPDFAVRMLKASVEAGFEAPIRVYVVEEPDGTAQVSYIKPSDVFAGYENAELDAMASELDTIFAAILHDAIQ